MDYILAGRETAHRNQTLHVRIACSRTRVLRRYDVSFLITDSHLLQYGRQRLLDFVVGAGRLQAGRGQVGRGGAGPGAGRGCLGMGWAAEVWADPRL